MELALPKMYEDRMVARGYVVRSGQVNGLEVYGGLIFDDVL